MKNFIITSVGIAGGFIVSLLGGWSNGLCTLIVFMAVDYLTGIIPRAFSKTVPKPSRARSTAVSDLKGFSKKWEFYLLLCSPTA